MWTIAAIAEAFHVLPSVVARDLDDDAEQLSIVCLSLLRLAEAHSAFKHAKDPVEDLRTWEGSKAMEAVEEYVFERKHARLHPDSDVVGCRGCEKARGVK